MKHSILTILISLALANSLVGCSAKVDATAPNSPNFPLDNKPRLSGLWETECLRMTDGSYMLARMEFTSIDYIQTYNTSKSSHCTQPTISFEEQGSYVIGGLVGSSTDIYAIDYKSTAGKFRYDIIQVIGENMHLGKKSGLTEADRPNDLESGMIYKKIF